jgi:hypothetical protein
MLFEDHALAALVAARSGWTLILAACRHKCSEGFKMMSTAYHYRRSGAGELQKSPVDNGDKYYGCQHHRSIRSW